MSTNQLYPDLTKYPNYINPQADLQDNSQLNLQSNPQSDPQSNIAPKH